MISHRTTKIRFLRAEADNPASTLDEKFIALRKLSNMLPGAPLQRFIRSRLRALLREHGTESPALIVDASEITQTLNETIVKKKTLAELAKTDPVPPFPIPAEYRDCFSWQAMLDKREKRYRWKLVEV